MWKYLLLLHIAFVICAFMFGAFAFIHDNATYDSVLSTIGIAYIVYIIAIVLSFLMGYIEMQLND